MKLIRLSVAVTVLIAAGVAGYHYWQQETSVATSPSAPATAKPVPSAGNVITHVAKPTVREVDGRAGLTLDELLDEHFRFFDTSQLKFYGPRALRNEAQYPVYLGEIGNDSPDTVLLKPRLTIRFFNDHEEVSAVNVAPGAVLYPGERLPFRIKIKAPYTRYQLEWANMKGAPLPGPRSAAQINIVKRTAERGSVLVNFSRRYVYKYVNYQAMLENTGQERIKDATVYITLYDAKGDMTGYEAKQLSSINLMPGDKYPFEVDVKQFGDDFTEERVVYSDGLSSSY